MKPMPEKKDRPGRQTSDMNILAMETRDKWVSTSSLESTGCHREVRGNMDWDMETGRLQGT